MGRAIELGQREQLIALKQQGHSLRAISEQLQLSFGTVRNLSARFKRHGNLDVGYSHCGPKAPVSDAVVARAAVWLRKQHPRWGAPLIRLRLVERYGKERTASARTLQRWFRHQHLTRPRGRTAPERIGTSRAPHNIWQVDAKENLTLVDGTEACYLTITDEHSGAGLEALVFPPRADLPGAGGAGTHPAD